MKKPLYLEERVSIARDALNKKSLQFQYLLPEEVQLSFNLYILDMITVLDGDSYGDAQERIKENKYLGS